MVVLIYIIYNWHTQRHASHISAFQFWVYQTTSNFKYFIMYLMLEKWEEEWFDGYGVYKVRVRLLHCSLPLPPPLPTTLRSQLFSWEHLRSGLISLFSSIVLYSLLLFPLFLQVSTIVLDALLTASALPHSSFEAPTYFFIFFFHTHHYSIGFSTLINQYLFI